MQKRLHVGVFSIPDALKAAALKVAASDEIINAFQRLFYIQASNSFRLHDYFTVASGSGSIYSPSS